MLHATETNLTLKGKIIKICSLIIKIIQKKIQERVQHITENK